jgi:quercetin dioxygenase-like cupin family protein
MKLYRFEGAVGVPITRFESRNVVIARGLRTTDATQVGVMHLGANGLVGYHQATTPQLFIVVAGEGWVRGGAGENWRIVPGQAAFWQKDEWHESGTETGMSALVVESESLDPSVYMQEV